MPFAIFLATLCAFAFCVASAPHVGRLAGVPHVQADPSAFALVPVLRLLYHRRRVCGAAVFTALVTSLTAPGLAAWALRLGLFLVRKLGAPAFQLASHLLARFNLARTVAGNSHDRLRSVFRKIPVPPAQPTRQPHTHPDSAASRSSFVAFAHELCLRLQCRVYDFQMSPTAQKAGLSGSRSWFWGKDVMSTPRNDPLAVRDVITMIDVDYYVDMPHFLSTHRRPVLLYTMVPEQASANRRDYDYTFVGNELLVDVHGAATYRHRIWNYCHDVIGVPDALFGKSLWLVERRSLGLDRQAVFLVPIGAWSLPLRLLSWFLYAPSLERLTVSQTIQEPQRRPVEFIRLAITTGEGCFVSTARSGAYSSATVPRWLDDEIADKVARGGPRITEATVRNIVQKWADSPLFPKDEATRERHVAILTTYHVLAQPWASKRLSSSEYQLRRVQHGTFFNPDAKPSMHAFMDPLLPEAFCFDQTRGNAQRAVERRVTRLASVPSPPLPAFERRIMEEFILKIAQPGSIIPVDEFEVSLRQGRPAQQRILAQAADQGPLGLVATVLAFLKKEVGAYGDPRIISPVEAQLKMDFSQFTYALSDIVEKFAWCGLGKTPRELAERMASICTSAKNGVDITDFSRYDGRQDDYCRDFEAFLIEVLSHPAYLERILDAHRRSFDRKANLSCDDGDSIRYRTAFSRLSGEPGTSIFNTILNAFIAYRTLRSLGFDADEAWEALGIYLGDDGATADIPPDAYKRSALVYSQKLDAVFVPRGELGVEFLSRAYSPEVWDGDANSMCKPSRQLAKLHVCTAALSGESHQVKLAEKCRGLIASDANTPVLGSFAACVLSHYCSLPQKPALGLRGFFYTHELDVRYPNSFGEWMYDVFERDIPGFDHQLFEDWIYECRDDPELLFHAPLFAEPSVPRGTATVNGEHLDSEEEVEDGHAEDVAAAKSDPQEHRPRLCYACRREGHLARDCPEA